MAIRCKIDSIDYLNHDTRRVLLRLPEGEAAIFSAGQYLEMVLPDRNCPFSIASKPTHEGLIELHIKPTPGSEDSAAIESFLDHASHIDVQLPLGDCFLTAPPNGPILLLAAGTGITQMKSIIEHIISDGVDHPLYLYWGVLSDKDLYLVDQCRSWSQTHLNFHFVPVVSEPESSPNWQGKTGLVGHIAMEDILQNMGDSKISDLTVYVSGGPGMVYATLDMLVDRGLPKENIHSDIFSYAPRR